MKLPSGSGCRCQVRGDEPATDVVGVDARPLIARAVVVEHVAVEEQLARSGRDRTRAALRPTIWSWFCQKMLLATIATPGPLAEMPTEDRPCYSTKSLLSTFISFAT